MRYEECRFPFPPSSEAKIPRGMVNSCEKRRLWAQVTSGTCTVVCSAVGLDDRDVNVISNPGPASLLPLGTGPVALGRFSFKRKRD
jgi:hypothetical protein